MERPCPPAVAWATLALLACAGAAGCGDDSAPPGASAPADTPASEIGAADREALCDEYLSGIGSIEQQCRHLVNVVPSFTGSDPAERRAACERIERFCLDNAAAGNQTLRAECITKWFATCEATVGEIERCFSDIAQLRRQIHATGDDCAALAAKPDASRDPAVPESCWSVVGRCPGFLSSKPAESETDPMPSEPEKPVVAACMQACERFSASCSGAACPSDCAILTRVYDAACDELGQRFFDCAAASTDFDCATKDLVSAPRACVEERDDYTACYFLGAPGCADETGLDYVCMRQNPMRPFSKHCVASAVPADCELFSTRHYCCARR